MTPYEIARAHLPSGWPEDGVCELADAIDEHGKRQWRDSRRMAMEHAAVVCEHDASTLTHRHDLPRAAEATRLAVVIRGLIDQPPPPARGEST